MTNSVAIRARLKHNFDFYLLSLGAVIDFFMLLPFTIIRQGETHRSWNKSKQRIKIGKSFRDFMLSGKRIDDSRPVNQRY